MLPGLSDDGQDPYPWSQWEGQPSGLASAFLLSAPAPASTIGTTCSTSFWINPVEKALVYTSDPAGEKSLKPGLLYSTHPKRSLLRPWDHPHPLSTPGKLQVTPSQGPRIITYQKPNEPGPNLP